VVIRALLYMFSECKCHRLEYLGWLSTSKRVGLLQSPNLMIIALFLKYQTDSSRSGLESGIQIYLLGSYKVEFNKKFRAKKLYMHIIAESRKISVQETQ
jgi:hypothetical protein